MVYDGNPNLPLDTKKKILETFLHALKLASSNKLDEARAGCEFILELDPLFRPASVLLSRLELGPPIAVKDLRNETQEALEKIGEEDDSSLPPLDMDDGLDLSLDDDAFVIDTSDTLASELPFSSNSMTDTVASTPPTPPSVEDRAEIERQQRVLTSLKKDIKELYTNKKYSELLALASKYSGIVDRDEELRSIVKEARETLETEAFIKDFVDKAKKALLEGREDEYFSYLERARSIDPTHPYISELETMYFEVTKVGSGTPGSITKVVGGVKPPDLARESDDEIKEILYNGWQSFVNRKFQEAIDTWSSILVKRIDHPEAIRLIEEAKKLRDEMEKEVNTKIAEAEELIDKGEKEKAKELLHKILKDYPDHIVVIDLLERIERKYDAKVDAAVEEEEVKEQAKVEFEFKKAPKVSLAAQLKKLPLKWITTGVVMVIAVIAFVFIQIRSSEKETEVVKEQPIVPDTIELAKSLYNEGKIEQAIKLLKGIGKDDPNRYLKAQTLIKKWEAEIVKKGPSEEDYTRRAELIEKARQFYEARNYLFAYKLFNEANSIAPLEGNDKTLFFKAQEEYMKLLDIVKAIEEGQYESVIRTLWEFYDANPARHDVRWLLAMSYYNMVINKLNQGDVNLAREYLKEIVNLYPDSKEIKRLLNFSQAYKSQRKDPLYWIFVKSLEEKSLLDSFE